MIINLQQLVPKASASLPCFAVLVLSTILAQSGIAQTNYAAFELVRENNWDTLATEDMDGDGRKDLVFSHFDAISGRELHIHHQKADGSFSSQPQRIEIKTEIVAIGFADLRSDPGKELILFANSGVFSLSTLIEGYSSNLKPLLQWELIAAVPDLEQVAIIDIDRDINGDGFIDLLLPGKEKFGVFFGGPDEQYTLAGEFDTRSSGAGSDRRRSRGLDVAMGINAEEGVSLKFHIASQSPYQDFIESWDQKDPESETLFRTETWIPNALFAQLNNDDLLDILYLNEGADGLGQLNIHYQKPDRGFEKEPDWTGSIDSRGEIQLADVNGDDKTDLVRVSGGGSDWNVGLFVNHSGQFDLEKPSQVMKFSGYDVSLDFVKLNTASTPVLSVNYYTIPVVDAIRNASITRTQLLYKQNGETEDLLFSRRPDARIEETFSAANVRGLSEQLSLNYDVDGDGSTDALYITDKGTIAAKRVDSQLQFSEDPFWEYVAPRSVFEFEVLNLNSDTRPDLILRHGNTSTILVALP